MAAAGIDTLTNNGPAHVLGLVMQPISYAYTVGVPDIEMEIPE
jgi:hypothetical protein